MPNVKILEFYKLVADKEIMPSGAKKNRTYELVKKNKQEINREIKLHKLLKNNILFYRYRNSKNKLCQI